MAKYFRMFIYIIKIFKFIQILKKKWAFGHETPKSAKKPEKFRKKCQKWPILDLKMAKSVAKSVGKSGQKVANWPNPYRKITVKTHISGQKVANWPNPKIKSGHKKSPDRPFSRVYQDNFETIAPSIKCVIHGFLK